MSIPALYKKFFNWLLNGPEWFYTQALEKRPGNYRSVTAAVVIWLFAFYSRILTVPGQFLAPVTGILIMYSFIAWGSPMRFVSVALLVVFVFDFVVSLVFRPKLRITRRVPRRIRAGSKFKIDYDLKNLRRMSAWDVKLDNYRLRPGIQVKKIAAAGVVPPRETITVRSEMEALRRGKYDIFSPIVDSSFPLGLFKMSRKKKGSPDVLLVYPAFQELVSLDLPVAQRYQKEGDARVSKVGESFDFFGNREFREGDDPRHIDWLGSARTGELIIKEFQQEYLSRIAIIVDTYVPPVKSFQFSLRKKPRFDELEASLSLTSALIDFLTRGEYVVDIFATGLDVYHFKAGRHLSCFDDIMDILASLEVNHQLPIHEISSSVIEEISSIGSVVVILQGWDKERQKLIDRLNSYGIASKVIIIGDREKITAPENIKIFSADDVEKGRVVKL
jgi:uncharacterized protein (DUF58 family)